jgi:hypothetical protein
MTSGEESDGERGFKIVDRRGEKSGEDAPEPTHEQTGESGARSGAADSARATPAAGAGENLPRIDFSTFVLSLGTSAMMHMGLVGDPESGPPSGEKNLPFARQTIDTLEMLQVKTRGNLDQEEAQLIESLLYDLHMRFVEASR